MKKINIKNIFTKDNVRRVGSFIETIFLGYCAVLAKADLVSNTNHSENASYIFYPADYSSAYDAIVNSDAFGSVKRVLCANLLKDRSTDYYKSVISIVKSDAFGSDKISMMTNLNKTFAENTSSIVK